MKKLAIGILCLVLCLGGMATAAQDEIKVLLNGSELVFDVPPQQIQDRTLVPVRAIFEAMGARIEWDDVQSKVTAVKGDTTIVMQIDSHAFIKNGVAIYIDVAPQLVDDRTLVPVRVIAESFGAQVGWDEENRTVRIAFHDAGAQPSPETGAVMDPNVSWVPDFGYYTGMQLGYLTQIEGGYGFSYYVEGYRQDGLQNYFDALRSLGFAGRQDGNTYVFVQDNRMLIVKFNQNYTQVEIVAVVE